MNKERRKYMLTVSVAVIDPDLNVFENLMKSLKQFTPEMSQLLVFDNGSQSKDFVNIAKQYFGSDLSDHKVKLTITHSDKNIGFAERTIEPVVCQTVFAVINDDESS
jgi:hypothetical protein